MRLICPVHLIEAFSNVFKRNGALGKNIQPKSGEGLLLKKRKELHISKMRCHIVLVIGLEHV